MQTTYVKLQGYKRHVISVADVEVLRSFILSCLKSWIYGAFLEVTGSWICEL